MIRNVHILGSVQNIKIARDAVVSLILGSPPGQSAAPRDWNSTDSIRKGLRSFEIRWSETQAAILELWLECRFDSCVQYSYLVSRHAVMTLTPVLDFCFSHQSRLSFLCICVACGTAPCIRDGTYLCIHSFDTVFYSNP